MNDAGQATKLRGNPTHPHTRGGLCIKVNPYLEFSRDPSRLMFPQRRTGAKGEGRFERITWDEAISTLADRLQSIIDSDGAEAIWPFDGTGNVGYLQGCGVPHRLWNALGTSRHRLSICSISGHVGMSYTTGSAAGMDPEDIALSRLIVLWGTNTLTSNQHLWPFIEQARQAGAYVVAIDPVRHRSAQRSDEHLAPRVGTDGALALGLCHVIQRQGVNTDFLHNHTVGHGAFLASLGSYSPEVVAGICDVDASAIIALGERMAATAAMAIKLGQGMQRHAHGGQAARVISCIPALTGDYHRRGGGLVYSTSPAYELNTYKASRYELRAGLRRELVMTRLVDGLRQTDPPVKALVVMGANPMVSNPAQDDLRSELGRDDLFTVVFDAFATDTARFADLLLPCTLQTEHTEVLESFGHLYLNWNEPAVAPPGECLSKTELMRRLAAAMGLTEPLLFASDHEIANDLLDSPTWRDAGIGVEELRSAGWLRIPGTEQYQPFVKRFATVSGKFEFVSPRAAADGHGLLPHYRPPNEAAVGDDGTFALVAAAGPFFVNSVFAGIERNVARAGTPAVTICDADAERLGLDDGTMVRVVNERGSFGALLRVSALARTGVAVTAKGAWIKHFHGDSSVNSTIAERDSDMGAGAVYHDNRVTIEPW